MNTSCGEDGKPKHKKCNMDKTSKVTIDLEFLCIYFVVTK